MPPIPPMPPPDAPGEPPILPPMVEPIKKKELEADRIKLNNKVISRRLRTKRVDGPVTPEKIAHNRTSEFAVRLLAGMAVQLAIKSRSPEKQNEPVKKAEQGYMSRLWNLYTKRALKI